MNIYHGVQSFKNVNKPVLTTGTFDGVHIGHKSIIHRINTIAEEVGGESVMLTFSPHPRMVIFPDDHGLKLLNTEDEKISCLEAAGLQHLVIQPFTKEFSKKTALEYVRELLVEGIQPYKMVVGYDHRFGKNREGDFQHLMEYGEMFEFLVEEIPAQMLEEVNVSSTKIRKAVAEGDISTANHYLGYNYPLHGIVIEGDGIGNKLGFATANVQVSDPNKLLPGNGVYAITAKIKGQHLKGMLNIGNRPTVNEKGELRIEAHLFDFDDNIYGEKITLHLIERIRSEKRFLSFDDLKAQLNQDKEAALNALA